MNFKIKDENLKLNFGVRFVAELDQTQSIDGGEGIEFGIGTMLAEEKLKMGNFETLATVIQHACHQHNVTLDEVYEAIDEYGESNDLETLFGKIEEELKNSNAVRTAKARMEATQKEANRKQGVEAVKPTKK